MRLGTDLATDARVAWTGAGTATRPTSVAKVRNLTVAGLSFILVFGAITYLWFPAKLAFAVNVTETRAAASLAAGSEVVYGKVTNLGGHAMAGVQIELTDVGDHGKSGHGRARRPAPPSARDRRSLLSAYHGVILAKATTGRDGMFQATVSAPVGSYSLRVLGAVRGHVGSAVKTLRLVPGHIYRVDVRVVRHGSPFFLPVLSY